MINTIISKTVDAIFPIVGGASGSLVAYKKYDHLLWMSLNQYIETFLVIGIGAVIGWLIKRALDWMVKNCKK